MYDVPKILLEDFYLNDLINNKVLCIYGYHATIVWPPRSKEKVYVNRVKPKLFAFSRQHQHDRMGTSNYRRDVYLCEDIIDIQAYLEKRGSVLRYSFIVGEVKVNRKRKIYNVVCVLSEATVSCLRGVFKNKFF